MVSYDEAESLLDKFVSLREQYKKTNSKKDLIKYNQCVKLCMEKFDYIVQNKVRKYKAFPNYDDLLQDGRVALVLALNSYETGKGSWFWWANQYVKTKISREANRHSTIKIPLKKTKKIIPHKVSQLPVMIDLSISASDSIEKKETESIIRDAVDKLPKIHKKVIKMYFQIGSTSTKRPTIVGICSELNISLNDYAQILSEAKDSLKRNLEDCDFVI